MFGQSSGEYLYLIVRGIDPGIYQGEVKSHSISEERTFWPDVYGMDALSQELLLMSQSVMFRALDEKSVGRTVTVKLRYGDFSTFTISETPKSGIYSSDDIYRIAQRLLEKKYNNTGVRLLGVALGGVYEGENPEQGEFFIEKKQKLRDLEKTILNLSKDGKVVTRAASIKESELAHKE